MGSNSAQGMDVCPRLFIVIDLSPYHRRCLAWLLATGYWLLRKFHKINYQNQMVPAWRHVCRNTAEGRAVGNTVIRASTWQYVAVRACQEKLSSIRYELFEADHKGAQLWPL
jgi:hypothetical protein